MLDDFAAVKLDTNKAEKKPELSSAGPGGPVSSSTPPAGASVQPEDPTKPKGDGEVVSDDDFAKQLQAGMAELMGELESSVLPPSCP